MAEVALSKNIFFASIQGNFFYDILDYIMSFKIDLPNRPMGEGRKSGKTHQGFPRGRWGTQIF